MSIFKTRAADDRLPMAVPADFSIPYREAENVSDADDRSFSDEPVQQQPVQPAPLSQEDWENEMRALVDLLNEAIEAKALQVHEQQDGRLRALFPRVRTVWEE